MHAHAQFCWSGDNTLPATKHAISTLANEDADEAIVLILSDANLRRYGIPPEHLGTILTSDPRVQAHVIFIGSLGDEANT
ncbi:jg17278, partial [Pararge aegeria aegeria]